MYEIDKRLFVGIKITPKLQSELDHCAPGTERYFKEDNPEYLQIVTVGEEKLIGKFLKDGFPASEINDVGRNVSSIVKLITRGNRIGENSVRVYVDCIVRDILGSDLKS